MPPSHVIKLHLSLPDGIPPHLGRDVRPLVLNFRVHSTHEPRRVIAHIVALAARRLERRPLTPGCAPPTPKQFCAVPSVLLAPRRHRRRWRPPPPPPSPDDPRANRTNPPTPPLPPTKILMPYFFFIPPQLPLQLRHLIRQALNISPQILLRPQDPLVATPSIHASKRRRYVAGGSRLRSWTGVSVKPVCGGVEGF